MRQRLLTLGAAALLLTAGPLGAREEPKSIPFVETGPFQHVDGTGPHRDSHELLKHIRNLRRIAADPTVLSSPTAESQDVGDVAVVVDNGSIVIPPRPANPFDLPVPGSLTFVPDTDEFTVSLGSLALDLTFGADLGLGDDDTAEVMFLPGFPFLGTTHTSIWVNSDGNITLGAGDSASTPRDAARHIGGPPRVSPLLNDLNPEDGGSVHADVRTDRLVVTWNAVPEFGISNSNTFQAVLHDSGQVDLVYGAIDATFGVVGVAEGDDEGPFSEVDYTADLPGTFGAGAIFEEFNPAILTKQMDVLALAQEFYKTHADKYDYLVMFTDFVVDIGFGAFAFHLGVQNQTQGLGLRGIFDATDIVGPGIDELESILNMNRIGLYWPDATKMVDPPIRKFRFFCASPAGTVVPCGATLDGPPGPNQISRRARWFGTLNGDFGFFGSFTLGLNSAMSIMGQEAGHRWLAFPLFVHPTKGIDFPSLLENTDLLGRAFSHWSFWHNVTVPPGQFGGDPRASSMEGNAIVDLGPGASAGLPVPCTAPGESTFLTARNELIDGYTELDQYFMGLRQDSQVSPFWYVDEPRSAFTGNPFPFAVASVQAQDDIVFCGKRVDLAVADIQAFPFFNHGPRFPALGDEVDQDAGGNPVQDVKTMAFILLVEQGPPMSPAHAAAIDQVDTFRATWEAYANGPATGGLGRFDTSLDPDVF